MSGAVVGLYLLRSQRIVCVSWLDGEEEGSWQETVDLMRIKFVAFCCGVSFYEWKRVSERNVLLIA